MTYGSACARMCPHGRDHVEVDGHLVERRRRERPPPPPAVALNRPGEWRGFYSSRPKAQIGDINEIKARILCSYCGEFRRSRVPSMASPRFRFTSDGRFIKQWKRDCSIGDNEDAILLTQFYHFCAFAYRTFCECLCFTWTGLILHCSMRSTSSIIIHMVELGVKES